MADEKPTYTLSFEKTYWERESRDGEHKSALQMVRWNKSKPSIVKRDFYKVEGLWRPGKMRGLQYEDWKIIRDRADEVGKDFLIATNS